MTSLRAWLIESLVLAGVAAGLPAITHFADGGLSILLVLLWLVSIVAAVMRFGRRGLWLLAGAPLALFWVFAAVLWTGDAHFGF
jgi:hypothetical protein